MDKLDSIVCLGSLMVTHKLPMGKGSGSHSGYDDGYALSMSSNES